MKLISTILLFLSLIRLAALGSETVPFSFEYDGNQLRGLIDTPSESEASSLIIIVHGHGKTNVTNGQWMDLRSTFKQLGITTVLWDKAGCGDSEGIYDHKQTVQSSTQEVLAAVEVLRRNKVPGVEHLGLWGISRAGWICPLVIESDPSIAFWISVSGTDEKENFGYLLESNFRIEGRTDSQVELLLSEWEKGNEISQNGGSFEDYLTATKNLREDSFWRFVTGEPYTAEGYKRQQKLFISEQHAFDESTGLMIYISGFKNVLSSISCPVLAIFGEKDTNVNWKNTLELYQNTIGNDNLTVQTFADGNHNIQKSKTGGFREMIANNSHWNPCDGYYDVMIEWLQKTGASN